MKQRIRAISLWQPWATLLAAGVKQWETRHWPTAVRGLVAIHAAKRRTMDQKLSWAVLQKVAEVRVLGDWDCPKDYPFGAIVGVGQLIDCQRMTVDNLDQWSAFEQAFGNYQSGRYAWRFEYTRVLPAPIPCVGHQGFFEVEVDL